MKINHTERKEWKRLNLNFNTRPWTYDGNKISKITCRVCEGLLEMAKQMAELLMLPAHRDPLAGRTPVRKLQHQIFCATYTSPNRE